MEKLRRPVRLLILILLLGACLWIAWRVPYTHDDWDWGSPQGLRWWFSGEMNNRYCGSFFVIVMTRSQLLKTLIMGVTMFALPLLAAEIAAFDHRQNRFPLLVLGCAALMAMPLASWRQTYGWVSAFSNFVVGGVWMLALILLVRTGLARGGSGRGIALALFPLAVTAQLFVENISVVTAAAALLFALWSWRTGRLRPAALSLLAGALLGLALMLYNPLYSELLSTGAAVQGVRRLVFSLNDSPLQILAAVTERFFCLILPDLFECYPALWALVCAGGVWRAVRAGRPWFLVLPAALFSAFFLLCCWVKTDNMRQGIQWPYPLPFLQVWGPIVLCLLLALTAATDPLRACRLPWLALLLAAIALVSPFSVLWDRGARCAFPSAVLLLLLGLSMLKDFPWHLPATAAATALLAAAVIFHIQVYQVIGGCSDLRAQLLQDALEQGKSSVILPTEDWSYFYFWERNPSKERTHCFRSFYGLPEDLELIFLPPGSYDVWPEVTPEMLYYAAIR